MAHRMINTSPSASTPFSLDHTPMSDLSTGQATAHHFPFVRLIRSDAPEYRDYCARVASYNGRELGHEDHFGHQIEALVRRVLAVEKHSLLEERVVARGRWFQEVDAMEWMGPSAVRLIEVKVLLGSQPDRWIRKGLWQLQDAACVLHSHFRVETRLVLVGEEPPSNWPCGSWSAWEGGQHGIIHLSFAELFARAQAAGLPVPERLPGVAPARVLWHNAGLQAAATDTPVAAAFARAITAGRRG